MTMPMRELPQAPIWIVLDYGPSNLCTWKCPGQVRDIVDNYVLVVRRWILNKQMFHYELITQINWSIFPYKEIAMPPIPSGIGVWTGPKKKEIDARHQWLGAMPIPPERWPYGPPEAHQPACILHTGGKFCDCTASEEGQ
jgi:hypothetical protein